MPKYLVNHAYASRSDGVQYGPWSPGDSVELLEAVAEWVNRDSPGTLSALPVATSEPAPVREAAPKPNRQARVSKNR